MDLVLKNERHAPDFPCIEKADDFGGLFVVLHDEEVELRGDGINDRRESKRK